MKQSFTFLFNFPRSTTQRLNRFRKVRAKIVVGWLVGDALLQVDGIKML